MRRRWLVFALALCGSAVLATGFAIGIDRALAAGAPPPHLATIPPATLASLGYTLSAPAVPPYCQGVQAAAARGWLTGGAGGCPITREVAEVAAVPVGGRTVAETLLARVTVAGQPAAAGGKLEWLVVVRYNRVLMPLNLCPLPIIGAPCPVVAPPAIATDVIFVDAFTGQTLAIVDVASPGSVSVPATPRSRPRP